MREILSCAAGALVLIVIVLWMLKRGIDSKQTDHNDHW